MPNLVLPKELDIIQELGSGRRSHVYLGKYFGKKVAVKVYKQEYIEKYQSQYKVNIGEFEFERNKTAYETATLTKYVAEPYQLLHPEQGYDLAFVQEYVDGIWLEELMEKSKNLPEVVLTAGYYIVEQAAKVGLYDLDIPPGNIIIRQSVDGEWVPTLYDFNLMPQHIHPPNPFMAIGFKLGLRSKNHRDYRSLRHWAYLGKQASSKK
jgi:RIO-like serine/threonine protein kinase